MADNNTDVLALKYRPKKLANVIGQDATVTTLTNAFNSGKLPQTFVFAGFLGCGKTSVARILAAMENCEQGRTMEPCGKCKMCRDIFDGESTDVKEVNAASDRGIDVIRNLSEFVSTRPINARIKYVILDEVHMLSREAAESALKLFEEPPDGVRFVLCTTDLHKMKGTTQSRCMPFRFGKVPWPIIVEHLKTISALESIQAEEASLKIAAKLTQGSVRNGLRNLQLLRTYAGDRLITSDLAQQAMGTVNDESYFELMDAVLAKDASTMMKEVVSIFSKGIEFQQVFDGMLDHLRTQMVILSCKNTSGIVYLSDDEKQRYLHQIGKIDRKLSIYLIVGMMDKLCEVARLVALNVNPQLLMEKWSVESIMLYAKLERELQAQTT